MSTRGGCIKLYTLNLIFKLYPIYDGNWIMLDVRRKLREMEKSSHVLLGMASLTHELAELFLPKGFYILCAEFSSEYTRARTRILTHYEPVILGSNTRLLILYHSHSPFLNVPIRFSESMP